MAMRDDVKGPNLRLRLILPQDALYVHELRINPAYNTHLSAVNGTVDDQRRWIEAYKEREAAGQEFYFIIARNNGVPCGTVRIYDIRTDSFTWGSWILDHNKPPKAALESALLVYQFAFDVLGKVQAVFDVRRDNARTLMFHRRFGANETHGDDTDLFFTYPRSQFEVDRVRLHQALVDGGQ